MVLVSENSSRQKLDKKRESWSETMFRGKLCILTMLSREEFGEVRSIDLCLSRYEMCHLRKSIDDYKNGIIGL